MPRRKAAPPAPMTHAGVGRMVRVEHGNEDGSTTTREGAVLKCGSSVFMFRDSSNGRTYWQWRDQGWEFIDK